MNNKEIVFEKLTVEEEVEKLTGDEESKVRGGEIGIKPKTPCFVKSETID